jgi:ribosomal-protein-alanine N-acetyltransferase
LLGRTYWHRGLATEAASASLQWGFEELALERIVAIVHPENLRSRRVIAKLGMACWGEARYFGMDCLRYEIDRALRDELLSLAPEG